MEEKEKGFGYVRSESGGVAARCGDASCSPFIRPAVNDDVNETVERSRS